MRMQAPGFDEGAGCIYEFGMAAANSLLEEGPVSVIDAGTVF